MRITKTLFTLTAAATMALALPALACTTKDIGNLPELSWTFENTSDGRKGTMFVDMRPNGKADVSMSGTRTDGSTFSGSPRNISWKVEGGKVVLSFKTDNGGVWTTNQVHFSVNNLCEIQAPRLAQGKNAGKVKFGGRS